MQGFGRRCAASKTTLQRLITLECQKSEQNSHIYAMQEKKAKYCDQSACNHRNPERLAYTVSRVDLQQNRSRNIAAVEREDRHEIDEPPKDVHPKESCHKRAQKLATKGQQRQSRQ